MRNYIGELLTEYIDFPSAATYQHIEAEKMAIFQTTFSNALSLNENVWILITISLKFVSKSPINNIPALAHILYNGLAPTRRKVIIWTTDG